MKTTKIFATAAIAVMMGAGPALADLVFPSLSYRTGPYAPNGIPFADGYADYFTLLNVDGAWKFLNGSYISKPLDKD